MFSHKVIYTNPIYSRKEDYSLQFIVSQAVKYAEELILFGSKSAVNGTDGLNAYDPKAPNNSEYIIYVPTSDPDHQDIINKINTMSRATGKDVIAKPIDIKELRKQSKDLSDEDWINFKHGALYLPNAFVSSAGLTSNGRFSGEQYYWDSYAYVLSMLSMHKLDEAKGIVRNFFYQLQNYGMVLNGNRTYYLGRSQPPLLSTMVMAIHTYLHDKVKQPAMAEEWIKEAYPFLKEDFENVWEKHSIKRIDFNGKQVTIGTYFDLMHKPCPEAVDEPAYVKKVYGNEVTEDIVKKVPKKHSNDIFIKLNNKLFFRRNLSHDILTKYNLVNDYETITYGRVEVEHDSAERASGFDPSKVSFEEKGASIAPVDLNSLLFKYVKDLMLISSNIGNNVDATKWRKKMYFLEKSIITYLWDDEQKIFRNRNTETNEYTKEPFISTVYPLTFGLADEDQAKGVAEFIMKNLFTVYGAKNVLNPKEDQWDNIWPITNYFLNKGFRMYNTVEVEFEGEKTTLGKLANKVANLFVDNMLRVYKKEGTMFEKYSPQNGTQHLQFEHYGNQRDFTWSAALFRVMIERINGVTQNH